MTTPLPGSGVQRTGGGSGDPVPVFRVSALRIPTSVRIQPGPAGAFERTVARHKISKDAAQELFDLHLESTQEFERGQQVAREEYYTAQQAKFLKEHGAQEKLALAKKMLQRYRDARGEQAYQDLMQVLNRDAGHFGPMIALLAFCNSPGAPGGLSKGAIRYGRAAAARIRSVIETWIIGPWRPGVPALAMNQEAGSDD